MSGGTIKSGNLQVGQDGTASNNFTWYQPAVADGTVRLGQGVAGATTKDMVTISGSTITLGGNLVQASTAAPAFSAYLSATQNTSSGVTTKVGFNAEEFDTANCFDSTTNYRFTPNIAGYYQINACVSMNGAAGTQFAYILLYKNGSLFKVGINCTNFSGAGPTISTLVYLNGTTDYLEVYGNVTASSGTGFYGGSADGMKYSYFQAFLARSA